MAAQTAKCTISVLLLAVLGGGCARDVHVRAVRPDQLFMKRVANVLTSGNISPRTEQLLRRNDMLSMWRRKPHVVLTELDERVRNQPDTDTMYALAELSYLTAGKFDRRQRKKDALSLYFATCGYAYYYLFDPALQIETNEYDPAFRVVCDLYNRSLANCIKLSQKQDVKLEDRVTVELVRGKVDVDVVRNGILWQPDDFGELVFASDYEVNGMANHYHTYGLGVPLIVVRNRENTGKGQDKFYPEESSFPVTAFLRMEGSITDEWADEQHATLELIDPLRVQTIEVAGRNVPLESDLTTPLGYYLNNAKLGRLGFWGLVRPESIIERSGLYMPQPYEKGKIPVVFVHGLFSSPLTWMQMFNDLRGDRALRDKYQFWFFIYPTGIPIPYSADLLRTALNDARQTLDPSSDDAAMDNMVLVGHSMGGLLSKMMVQQSKDELWKLVSLKDVKNIDTSEDERQRIQQVFFFEPQNYVRRVVFIGVPHGGSRLSKKTVGRLGSSLIELPGKLLDSQQALLTRNPDAFTQFFQEGLPTSVDNLSPESPVIQTILKLPINDDVPYHSIIGVDEEKADLWKTTDGVVPYHSSHVAGAQSEYIVNATHSTCQKHPLTVLEVRRILLEHLSDDPLRSSVIQASADKDAGIPTVAPISLGAELAQ